MVWARSKLMIEDDLLGPLPIIRMKFTRKNPERLYKDIYNLLLLSFRVHEHSIQEKDFVWTQGDTDKFTARWELNKDIDKFTYYFVDVKINGEMSKEIGKIEIEIEGKMRTEYPQDTFWQRSLLYEVLRMFWNTVFYGSKREEYMREGRRMLSTFCDQVKALARV